MSLNLVACGGGTGGTDPAAQGTSGISQIASELGPGVTTTLPAATGTATAVQPRSIEGRLLASNCFQCHGTQGTAGFDSIRGSEASEVLEFMSKPASRDIMAAHAQGYTPEQLRKIIAYLQR